MLTAVATRATRLAPERPFCAVGDVHGRPDLLAQLYRRLCADHGDAIPVIFLGDYVDRGPDSAGALRMVHDLVTAAPDRHVALTGNHERMMLEFIDDPAGKGARWLSFGGIEAMQSFGITEAMGRMDPETALDAAAALADVLGAEMLTWLRGLPVRWSSGNMHCVHAGMDPERAVADQPERVLISGHPGFLTTPRTDEATVVHGHTVMSRAAVWDGRVSLDTGAYFTGRLTAAFIDRDTCTFIA